MTRYDKVIDYLGQLPDGYRERAFENLQLTPLSDIPASVNSIADALEHAFIWSESPEGKPFWIAVHDYYKNPPALPVLPPTWPKNMTIGRLTDTLQGMPYDGGEVIECEIYSGGTFHSMGRITSVRVGEPGPFLRVELF